MNNNHNTTFKKLQQSNTYIPTSPPPSNSSPHLNNNNGEMMKKIWKSCGKKALLKFKLVELKEELRKKSLTLNGNKAEIVERLHEKYMSEEQASSNPTTTSSTNNDSPESISNSSSSPAIKSSLTTTPNSNSSINERKSAYMKRNSNSAAVTFAPFSAMNNTSQSPISSPPKDQITPPSSFRHYQQYNLTNSPPLSNNSNNNSTTTINSKKGHLSNTTTSNNTSTTGNTNANTSNNNSTTTTTLPPTLSTLPSSLYNPPPLFYNKQNYGYPKLPSLPPYPQPYGIPNYSYLNFPNSIYHQQTSNTKKKKKKLEKKEEIDTDEFLSIEEIECYNSQIDYNSSSDETLTQKRCLSDTELYFETFENEALNNLLYSSTPHKKKQKQDHEFYEDLFYDRNKEEELEKHLKHLDNSNDIKHLDNIKHCDKHGSDKHGSDKDNIKYSNDIGFRVKCIIDGNTSEEKDVFIRDDKKWEDVVNHLLNDYRSFYYYFNFEFISNDFNAILHSKCEDVNLISNSTIQSISLSNRDLITINLNVIDHSCKFELQVDSITSLNLHSYEDEEQEENGQEHTDGYDQDNEDDEEEEFEEEEEEEESAPSELAHDHDESMLQQDDLYDQQVLLNLIESI